MAQQQLQNSRCTNQLGIADPTLCPLPDIKITREIIEYFQTPEDFHEWLRLCTAEGRQCKGETIGYGFYLADAKYAADSIHDIDKIKPETITAELTGLSSELTAEPTSPAAVGFPCSKCSEMGYCLEDTASEQIDGAEVKTISAWACIYGQYEPVARGFP